MVPAGALALLRAAASWSRASFPRSVEYPTIAGNTLESLGLLGNAAGAGNGAAASLASYSTSGTSTLSRSMTRAHSRNLESSPSAAFVESVRGGGIASRAVGSSPPPPPSAAAVSPAMVRACASNAAGDASVRSVSALIATPATARTRAPHGGPVGGRGDSLLGAFVAFVAFIAPSRLASSAPSVFSRGTLGRTSSTVARSPWHATVTTTTSVSVGD
mmetsp:Transcript_9339/g.40982  ORF Transcript_9339/g.40982 Transcript_9339/m.40982 type:complete len:217 (+) Transcript_9339:420-1070(+)